MSPIPSATAILESASRNGPPAAVEFVETRAHFGAFVSRLALECSANPRDWPNDTLPAYLEAMAAWLHDMDGYYANKGQAVPEQPTWQMLAHLFQAARLYE